MSPWQVFCQQVRFICRKELLAIWKDKAFRYVLVIPTLVLGVVFGYTATFNVENVTYAVLDQSHSEASTSLLATLDGTQYHIDTTWGDSGNSINYDYFAMTPSESWSHHSW